MPLQKGEVMDSLQLSTEERDNLLRRIKKSKTGLCTSVEQRLEAEGNSRTEERKKPLFKDLFTGNKLHI